MAQAESCASGAWYLLVCNLCLTIIHLSKLKSIFMPLLLQRDSNSYLGKAGLSTGQNQAFNELMGQPAPQRHIS